MGSLFADCVPTERGEAASRHFQNCLDWLNGIHIYCWLSMKMTALFVEDIMFTAVFVLWSLFFTQKQVVQICGINTGNQTSSCLAHKRVCCMSTCFCECVFKLYWQTPWNIQCEAEVLTATVQADPSVAELPICDFKAWLMDADLAPCSLSVPFSIYQPRDVSWFTPLSLFHFLLVERSTRVHLGSL